MLPDGPPPTPFDSLITPPSAVHVAAPEMASARVMSTPMEIHAKMPSSTESPRSAYSSMGSKPVAADSLRMLSAELSVTVCVLTAYVAVAATSVSRSWSKKSWPVCDDLAPEYVLFSSTVPPWDPSTWICVLRPV
uniref:Uncharacterized protein n=1 Tax=Globisporangium ultimum (strain ATCC 200006 / CBS 805.95 / DAOM BR144) TaxID=431595 RepID=K3XBR9_GLOUD